MKDVAYYRDREQTYLKHFFLERYLDRVAWVIGSTRPTDFVYVDGFSGPWKSEDENFEDTSFVIAINKLREVRKGLVDVFGRAPKMRCLFVEKDPKAYVELERAIGRVTDIEVRALPGEFESLIPEILDFIGRGFSLVFIDPTGWTGFALKRIRPILEHKPGEVLVNFMFDYINRFRGDPQYADSFHDLMGGPGWENFNTEDELVNLYRERVRAFGSFGHVTMTQILKPLSDRSYFYLVYGTRHIQGLREFRTVERKSVEEQKRVRVGAKLNDRAARFRMDDLFSDEVSRGEAPSDELDNYEKLHRAKALLRSSLDSHGRVCYDDVLGPLLEIPLICEPDIQKIIRAMRDDGELEVQGLTGKERTCKEGRGHMLVSQAKDR